MKIRNVEVFQLHADFCRILSSPKRLMILSLLSRKEMSVGELAESMDTALATVSQHLMVLRSKQIVRPRKEGQTVYYKIIDPRLIDACILIRAILLDGMKKRGEIAREIEIDPMGVIG
jgi:DNA-binding transcriptional ArsR family regulator